MQTQTRYSFISLVVLFGALALWPFAASSYGMDLVAKMMIYALLALSLELLVGSTGLVCFGQAAFFGVGAYVAVLLAPTDGSSANLLFGLVESILLAGFCALLIGSLSLKTSGVYFIMVTLAFAQMTYFVIHDTPVGGGSDGIFLYVKPTLGGLDLDKPMHLYGFIWISLLLAYAFLSRLVKSPFGRALSGIRVNEQRMKASGFSTYPYKLGAFTVSGMIAGWAGYLFAIKDGFVNPELLSWHLSGAVLVMIILGGLGRLGGALIGAFAFAVLQEIFQSEALFGSFAKHWQLSLGLAIIGCVAFMPNGLIALPSQFVRRLTGSIGPEGLTQSSSQKSQS